MKKSVGRKISDLTHKSLGQQPLRYQIELFPKQAEDLPSCSGGLSLQLERGVKISLTDPPVQYDQATGVADFSSPVQHYTKQTATIYKEGNKFGSKDYVLKLQEVKEHKGVEKRKTLCKCKVDLAQYCSSSTAPLSSDLVLSFKPKGKLKATLRTTWLLNCKAEDDSLTDQSGFSHSESNRSDLELNSPARSSGALPINVQEESDKSVARSKRNLTVEAVALPETIMEGDKEGVSPAPLPEAPTLPVGGGLNVLGRVSDVPVERQSSHALQKQASVPASDVEEVLEAGGTPVKGSGWSSWLWPFGSAPPGRPATSEELWRTICEETDLGRLRTVAKTLLKERNEWRLKSSQIQQRCKALEYQLDIICVQKQNMGDRLKQAEDALLQLREEQLLKDLVEVKVKLAQADLNSTTLKGLLSKEKDKSRQLAVRLTAVQAELDTMLAQGAAVGAVSPRAQGNPAAKHSPSPPSSRLASFLSRGSRGPGTPRGAAMEEASTPTATRMSSFSSTTGDSPRAAAGPPRTGLVDRCSADLTVPEVSPRRTLDSPPSGAPQVPRVPPVSLAAMPKKSTAGGKERPVSDTTPAEEGAQGSSAASLLPANPFLDPSWKAPMASPPTGTWTRRADASGEEATSSTMRPRVPSPLTLQKPSAVRDVDPASGNLELAGVQEIPPARATHCDATAMLSLGADTTRAPPQVSTMPRDRSKGHPSVSQSSNPFLAQQ